MSVFSSPVSRLLAFLALSIVILSQATTSLAQSSALTGYDDRLATYIQTQMATYHIPGLSIAIVREGEVEYLNGFGVANADSDPVTPNTPFLLASVSKSMTAIGVLQLVETGQIALDDPVQTYIPWFNVADDLGGQITIADLLHHTSGLPTLKGIESLYKPDVPNALAEGVRDLTSISLNGNPGTVWEYSNLNYNILGLVIQEVTGQSYQTYIEENIFAPLEMPNSYASISAANAGDVASGYYPFFGMPIVYEDYWGHSGASLPAAGLWSTASDMSHYLMAHLDDGQYQDSSVISADVMAALHEPGFEIDPGFSYGGGWYITSGFVPSENLESIETTLKNYVELTLISHEGDYSNFKSVVLMIPEADLGIVLLMNTNDPTTSSVFRFFAWDIAMIATGGEIQYSLPNENFLVRYGRWIFVITALLLLAGWVWTIRQFSKRNLSSDAQHAIGWRRIILHVGLPLIVSLVVLGTIYLWLLPENAITLPLLLRVGPDLGIIIGLVTTFSLGWSATGLFLLIKSWVNKRPDVVV